MHLSGYSILPYVTFSLYRSKQTGEAKLLLSSCGRHIRYLHSRTFSTVHVFIMYMMDVAIGQRFLNHNLLVLTVAYLDEVRPYSFSQITLTL